MIPTIEQTLYTNYIKYDIMSQLTKKAFSNSNATRVNIFIDVYSIIKPLLRKVHSYEDPFCITAIIVNLCAHIRHYFRSRHSVSSNIYIINTNIVPEYSGAMCSDYNQNLEAMFRNNKEVRELIISNMNLLHILAQYLPNIYYISNTHYETATVIAAIIQKNMVEDKNYDPNIIYTKDQINYQIIGLTDNTVVYRPKKYKEDLSYVITSKELYHIYKQENKVNFHPETLALNPALYTLLLSLSNMTKARELYSLHTISKALKIIYKALDEGVIFNDHNRGIDLITTKLDLNRGIDPELINRRFKAIDCLHQLPLLQSNIGFYNIKESIVDLHHPEQLQAINNEYFKINPLDLNRL